MGDFFEKNKEKLLSWRKNVSALKQETTSQANEIDNLKKMNNNRLD